MAKIIGNQLFKTASHCVYRLSYHVVFCVKFRRHMITRDRRELLFQILREIASECNCEVTEINGEEEHVHFILEAPPSVFRDWKVKVKISFCHGRYF